MWGFGWYIKKYITTGEEVICISKPETPSVVRSGRGWGRNGKDKYYLYEPPDIVRRLVKRPVKKLGEKRWVTCVEDRESEKEWCFDWINGKLVLVKHPLIP